MPGLQLLAINVGNTRTQIGRFEDTELHGHARFDNDDLAPIVQAIVTEWGRTDPDEPRHIGIASVNDEVADRLASMIEDQLSVDAYRVGTDLPIMLMVALDPETITGVDRLLNAVAAFARVKQACVIVDAGTAVTVDFVDGEGTFHGGAIAPGGHLQLKALHDYTSALPEMSFTRPDDEPFGRSTGEAMLKGVYHGLRGMVQRLLEIYSESYGAFPLVVATGGDAAMLFEDDGVVDQVVPDLTLRGIAECFRAALARDPDQDADVTG